MREEIVYVAVRKNLTNKDEWIDLSSITYKKETIENKEWPEYRAERHEFRKMNPVIKIEKMRLISD